MTKSGTAKVIDLEKRLATLAKVVKSVKTQKDPEVVETALKMVEKHLLSAAAFTDLLRISLSLEEPETP